MNRWCKTATRPLERGCDGRHFRVEIAPDEETRDFSEVDPKVFDSRAIRNREVGGDSDQHFMQDQSLRSKGDQLGGGQTREELQLGGRGQTREDVLGSKDGAQRTQLSG
jgi:hypothetical protein